MLLHILLMLCLVELGLIIFLFLSLVKEKRKFKERKKSIELEEAVHYMTTQGATIIKMIPLDPSTIFLHKK